MFWIKNYLIIIYAFVAIPVMAQNTSAIAEQNYLFFEPQRNDVSIKNPLFSFDLTNKRSLKLGASEFSKSDFDLKILPFGFKYLNHYQVLKVMGFKWPQDIMKVDRLVLENEKGKELFSFKINSETRDQWKKDLVAIRRSKKIDKYSTGTSTYHRAVDMAGYHIGIVEKKEQPVVITSKRVRFCIYSELAYNSARVCSDYYSKNSSKEYKRVRRPLRRHKTLYKVNNRKLSTPRGRLPVTSDLKLDAKLSTGFEINLMIQRPKMNVLELVRSGNDILLYGEGDLCQLCEQVSAKTMVEYYNPITYLQLLNLGRTYNRPKTYWRMKINMTQEGFSYDQLGKIDSVDFSLDYRKLLERPAKPVVEKPVRSSTYSSSARIYIKEPEGTKVSALENTRVVQGKKRKYWSLDNLERGKNNNRYLAIDAKGDRGVLKHSIYRGYATEMSGRGTVVSSQTASFSLISEINVSHWWEDLMGWENELLSIQRWGLNVKYFNSIIDFQFPSGEKLPLSSFTGDLKYRLTPGLWNRDETYGVSLSYQDLTFGRFFASMWGVGFTWARSMPKVFDDIINIVPFMRYPKWVEAEFLYYPLPAAPRTTGLGLNFALNYRGKILWSQKFFGEAGFGIKSFDFGDNQENKRIRTFLFYATGGLGFQF